MSETANSATDAFAAQNCRNFIKITYELNN